MIRHAYHDFYRLRFVFCISFPTYAWIVLQGQTSIPDVQLDFTIACSVVARLFIYLIDENSNTSF